MLVLFVLSCKLFEDKQVDFLRANVKLAIQLKQRKSLDIDNQVYKAKLDSLMRSNANMVVQLREKRKLDYIKAALKRLDNPQYFIYNQEFKRYELNFEVLFEFGKYDLPLASRQPLIDAGKFLLEQLQVLDAQNSIQYLVIIEGRAAMNPKYPVDHPENADYQAVRQLSYNRALSVTYLWAESGIRFPANIEVVPAGSGYRGAGRYSGYVNEQRNKRFIIQIQPKIGSISSEPAL